MPTPASPPASRAGGPQPVEDVPVQPEHVPVQRRPAAGTGPLRNRLTSCSSTARPAPTRPSMTRPLDAPRSTAASDRRPCAHRRNAAATPESTGMCRPVVCDRSPAGQREHGVGDVLGQHLALEQGALGVVGAELLLRHAVDGGALGAPAAGEDAGAADHAVGVDAVDPDAVRARARRRAAGPGGPGRPWSPSRRCCSGRRTASSSRRCRRCRRPCPARSSPGPPRGRPGTSPWPSRRAAGPSP